MLRLRRQRGVLARQTSDVGPQPGDGSRDGDTAGLALEFLLFDLSACLQPESETPKPPPVK